MNNISIRIEQLTEYHVGDYVLLLHTLDMDTPTQENVASSLLTTVASYTRHSRQPEALCLSAEELEGRYVSIIMHRHVTHKIYCLTQDIDIYIAHDQQGYTITDQRDIVSHMPADQVMSMENGVIAELYDDGSCLFKDKYGQRLNRQYLDAMSSTSRPLISRQDFTWLLSKTKQSESPLVYA